MSKKTIGVSMIVRNESAVIEACLESVKGADEIVIVDTGSTDNTIEICKRYTNKVYTDEWRDDFAYSRNVSLKKCKADYILIIDADEVLTTPIARIKHQINEYWFRSYAGMTFEVITGAETFESPRLFKNCKEIYYVGAVHNLPSWNGDVPELQSKLYHSAFSIDSGYSPSHLLDPDRTLRILLSQLALRPTDTRMMYYLAKEYMNREDVLNTVKWLESYRTLKYYNCEKWDNELADALYLLGLCYIDEVTYGGSRWHDSLQMAFESFAVLPSSSQTAELLSELFGQLPGSTPEKIRRQQMSHEFWKLIAKNSTNRGVLMKRNFKDAV